MQKFSKSRFGRLRGRLVAASAAFLFACLSVGTPLALAQEDESLLDLYRSSIYQVVVNNRETGNKSALGSGFQVSPGGLIVTNYHVVSAYIFEPEDHELQYVDWRGVPGELYLIDFDVVNDVALLQARGVGESFFLLSEERYRQGDRVFAMGNPHDYGMLMVDGAYNGIAENSYIDKILFSGSLNSGMSGGPAIDRMGRIVGVNVATAGSQLSFLVPADKVMALMTRDDSERPTGPDVYKRQIRDQLAAFQQEYFDMLMDEEWKPQPIGEHASVIGEMSRDISCWGGSNQGRDDQEILILELSCNNGNHTFLENRFNTAQMHYSFYYYETDELTADQFHDQVGPQNFFADNSAPERYMTGFRCEQSYLDIGEGNGDGFRQAGICFRGYRDFPGLYDSLFYLFQGQDKRALVSHFTLAAVEPEMAMEFAARFMEVAKWN